MNIRINLFFAVCFAIWSASAQVVIPPAYMGKFPYYLGNTKHEIEPHLSSGKVYKTIKIDHALLDTGGLNDVSGVIQAYLDSASLQADGDTLITVELPVGRMLITDELHIPSNTVLKGQGLKTIILVHTGENRHGIVISPKEKKVHGELQLVKSVARGDNEIMVEPVKYKSYVSAYGVPKYITLQKLDDSGLVMSDWAKGSIKEHYLVEDIFDKGAFISLKLAHPLSDLGSYGVSQDVEVAAGQSFSADSFRTKVLVQSFTENAGVKCLALQRLDSTASQTSNIYIDQACNCFISDVVSTQTNFSHICINNSAFNIVKRCAFSKSHGYGGNGRAYGVAIQIGSSSNVVMDNYFSTLRHAMLLQAGANANVLYANRSVNAYWEEGSMPKDAAGDIVLHGNYVYNNLVEMNHVQQIVVDDSHGRNGPRNIFFRNRMDNYGILMSASNGSDSQVFVGNEMNNTGFLKAFYMLKDKGHFEFANYVKGKLVPAGNSGVYQPFIWRPECAKDNSELHIPVCFPAFINPPFGNPPGVYDDSLPVEKRMSQKSYLCGSYYDRQFGAFQSSIHDPQDLHFLVYPNPASAFVKISVEYKGSLSLYDFQGKLLRTQSVDAGDNVMQLQGLDTGLYLLNFESDEGRRMTAKLIIRQ